MKENEHILTLALYTCVKLFNVTNTNSHNRLQMIQLSQNTSSVGKFKLDSMNIS